VTNARPDVTSLSPGYAPFGADGATITVHGKGFVAVSVGRWNGMDRATTFVSASELKVALTAEDLITMGEGRVSVFNPEPGGGEWVDGLPLTVGIKSLASLDLKATDLVYDSIGKKIYAAIDPADSKLANHVVRIDPMTGEIEDRVAFQTAPRRLAVSDDGRYLYVVANSASTVHRLALGTLSADLEFEVDPAEATIYASDLEVLPGRPGSVAIARLNSCCSPGFEGVAIYDDGVMRPTLAMKPGEASATVIEFAESDTLLYGFNNHTNEFGFRRLIVADTGVTEASVQKNLVYRLGADIRYAGGRIYTTDGGIVDPVAGTRVGDLNFGYHGPSIPDPANGRVLFLYSARLRAYSTTTLDIIDMHRVPGDDGRFADNLIRWGEDGLAYRTADRIFILRTNLVK
jgi:hypothetical protein